MKVPSLAREGKGRERGLDKWGYLTKPWKQLTLPKKLTLIRETVKVNKLSDSISDLGKSILPNWMSKINIPKEQISLGRKNFSLSEFATSLSPFSNWSIASRALFPTKNIPEAWKCPRLLLKVFCTYSLKSHFLKKSAENWKCRNPSLMCVQSFPILFLFLKPWTSQTHN